MCKNEKALNDHIRHKHRLLSCEYCHEQFTRQKLTCKWELKMFQREVYKIITFLLLTAHLRNIHRSEIDVELAGESDNYYKSQLLNNNNDITQISFNLLNTQQTPQQTQQKLTDTSLATNGGGGGGASPSCTTTPTSALTTTSSLSLSSSNVSLNANTKHLTTSSVSTLDTSTVSTVSSLACSLTNNCTSITNTNSPNNNNNNNVNILDDNVDVQHHQQICDMFATDPHDTNATSLALNGLVSNEHDDLSLHANDTANMFLVPSTTTSSATNDDDSHHHHQLDQYFMASLIDTEQEIIVT